MIRLGVNIDHVATLRNARNEVFPSVLEAALVAETNGADLITVHLREDRRHIMDEDVYLLRQALKTELNLEMALTEEMLEIALKISPDYVCLVPEKRQELTTEGGLDVVNNFAEIANVVSVLTNEGIKVSLFVDPNSEQIIASRDTQASSIELHTGSYAACAVGSQAFKEELYLINEMSKLADSLDLEVHAGHGLNYANAGYIAKIPEIRELNIGFAIIAQSIFWGLEKSVATMKSLLVDSRKAQDSIL